MALTIDYGATNIISVPQADLILVSPGVYQHDVNAFRLELKSIEDDSLGMPFPRTHNHNTEIVLSGVTYARIVEILSPYTIQYEDTGSGYTVSLTGANNNIVDVLDPTPLVTLVSNNSAGLQTVFLGGSGLSAEQATQLLELYTRLGLNIADPITDTTGGIDSQSGDIDIDRTGDGETTSTLTRQ